MNKEMLTPQISLVFDKEILSKAHVLGDNLEQMYSIFCWIYKNLSDKAKRPCDMEKFELLEIEFMEIYERAKVKEKEREGQNEYKAKEPFYHIRSSNRSHQSIFNGLRYKRI